MWVPGAGAGFRENMVVERRRFSWEEMCSRILELYDRVKA